MLLPTIQDHSVAENYGLANHPPANQGPRPRRPTPYRGGRNAKIPSPAGPSGPAPAGVPENAPPVGRIPADRARNRAVDRHWSPERNRSTAVRPATRPFVRVRGKHAAMSRRQRWERQYVRALILCDLFAGVSAGAVTFGLRFG
ncbi:MAG TPA: hypothetical protein VGP57_17010, partial [Actinoplanes sp.]|nr:hypothetical protein [Actinoplanes sp.]